ncbi:helix-turn-helix domain-containing protein [Candidatus Tisiphia endosymbiont of Oplodontha viridula]|uniref:helix-turn-helix domain-containing protein n=1 Tax=Candidatus Tisiphia endosymbiont of Oplodontha viridula TaxID=3077925 RepID=UPI0035C8D3C6
MIKPNHVQKFLIQKLSEYKLKKKEFAVKINIPYSTITNIFNTKHIIPELITLLKIANYFDCSVDKILGRTKYSKTNLYNNIDMVLNDITGNLRNFINDKIQEQNLNPYILSSDISLGKTVIYDFIKKNSKLKMLSTPAVISLADYFQVSVDEMIGRTKPITAVNYPKCLVPGSGG